MQTNDVNDMTNKFETTSTRDLFTMLNNLRNANNVNMLSSCKIARRDMIAQIEKYENMLRDTLNVDDNNDDDVDVETIAQYCARHNLNAKCVRAKLRANNIARPYIVNDETMRVIATYNAR